MKQQIKKHNKLWIRIIGQLIWWNEKILFYPKLKNFYLNNLNNSELLIIDVGANKGQSIEFFSSIHANVYIHSFEPNKTLFTNLKQKYGSNSKITLLNYGVSDKIGTSMFYENVLDETSSLEKINPNSEYLDRKAKVLGIKKENIIVDQYHINVITLNSYINTIQNKTVDVLKIDVEGHELSCLKGLFIEKSHTIPVKFIQLECHRDDMYLNNIKHEEIHDLLQENGFKKVTEIKHGFGNFFEIIYVNKINYEA